MCRKAAWISSRAQGRSCATAPGATVSRSSAADSSLVSQAGIGAAMALARFVPSAWGLPPYHFNKLVLPYIKEPHVAAVGATAPVRLESGALASATGWSTSALKPDLEVGYRAGIHGSAKDSEQALPLEGAGLLVEVD